MITLSHTLMRKTNLKVLSLQEMYHLGNKKAKALTKVMEQCNKVKQLTLKEIELDEEDAKYIGYILSDFSPSLIRFELSGIFFKNSILLFLKGLETNNNIQEIILEKILLDENNMPSLLSAICTNTSLKLLDLSNNPIRKGVVHFREHNLSKLETLKLSNCDIEDEAFLLLTEGIRNYKILRIIELNNNSITDNSITNVVLFFNSHTQIEYFYILNNPLCKRDLNSRLKDDHLTKVVAEI